MLLPTDYDIVYRTYNPLDAASLTQKINYFLSEFGSDYMPIYLANQKIQLNTDALNSAFTDWKSEGGLLAVGLKSSNGMVLRITNDKKEYKDVRFPNTLRIGFNLDHLTDSRSQLMFDQLMQIFRYCLDLCKPYYAYGAKSGEINHSKNRQQISRVVDVSKVPIAIEWFNYFGPEWIERLGGLEKLLRAPAFLTEPVTELGGAILILQNTPFDYRNDDHLQKREAVEEYLNLRHIHKMFPR